MKYGDAIDSRLHVSSFNISKIDCCWKNSDSPMILFISKPFYFIL